MPEPADKQATIRLTVKLGTALSEYRAASASSNRFDVAVSAPATVADVVSTLGIPEDRRLMIIVNGTLVTSPEIATHAVSDGDAVSLMTPIHAG